ncbi:MAG: GNAT family N-acetyltransferase [Actinomycetota bacterium]
MSPHLRPLRRDDIEELRSIDLVAHGEAWSYALFVDQITEACFRHRVAVDVDGAILGHGATWQHGTALRLINIAIAEDARGAGAATALLLDLFAGIDDMTESVELEVRPANRAAQRLYSRFGFVPVGIERGFYDRGDATGSCDALIMRIDDPADPAWRERLQAIARTLQEGAAA